jgi:hypothetical protein
MTRTVSLLTWQDTAQEDAPVASYAVDFAADSSWQWQLEGSYLSQAVTPSGVTIDNTGSGTDVIAFVGGNQVRVFAYTRNTISIGPGIRLLQLTGAAPSVINATFFVKDPPAGGAQQNILAVQQAVTAALQWTDSTISGNRVLGATDANTLFMCIGALQLTLPLTSTVGTHYVLMVYAIGGAVILRPDPADRIEGGAVGSTFTLPQFGSCLLTTDAAGSWWALFGGNNDAIAGTFTSSGLNVGSGAFTVSVAGAISAASLSVTGNLSGTNISGGTVTASGTVQGAGVTATGLLAGNAARIANGGAYRVKDAGGTDRDALTGISATSRVLDHQAGGFIQFTNQAATVEFGRVALNLGFTIITNNAPIVSGFDTAASGRSCSGSIAPTAAPCGYRARARTGGW